MKPSALLVMGDDVAACLLVHAYRKFDRKSRVILVARTRDLGYSHRLLPYYSVGLTTSLRMFSQQLLELVDTVRVVLLDEIELVGMDRVIIRGEVNPLSRLVIAGWLAPHPYRRQVLHLSNPQSAEELRDLLEAGLRSVVVLEGLGALPLVDALVRVGIRPIFVLGSEGVNEVFDLDVGGMLLSALTEKGVRMVSTIEEAPGDHLHVAFPGGILWIPPQLRLEIPRRDLLEVDGELNVEGNPRLKAVGYVTRLRDPETGLSHRVLSEEEAILQALTCALSFRGFKPANLCRYYAAWLGDRLYSSLGLTQSEARKLGLDVVVTRVRGWGSWSGSLVKLIATRDGALIGAQLILDSSQTSLIGPLYYLVCSKAHISSAHISLSPFPPLSPPLDDPLHHALQALVRKLFLRQARRWEGG